MSEARDRARSAHESARALAQAPGSVRSVAIRRAASHIEAAADEVIAANGRDMARAETGGMSAPLLDRLRLDRERVAGIVSSMGEVADQPDPIGRVIGGSTLASGIRMERVTVPLGVVAMIYEARPNVTADAFSLCVRSGNACVLRAGTAARESCAALASACREGLADVGLPQDALGLVLSEDRSEAEELMRASGLVDVLIPRGGASLIRTCVERATVPVIETGVGNCHVYLHRSADLPTAVGIVVNAKCSRPGVCNAAESLLVDDCAAERLLPEVLTSLSARGVELVGDGHAREVARSVSVPMGEATEDDWGQEYLDLKMSVRCVADVDEAIDHVNRYGTGHSEAIVTTDYDASERFLAGVDAAAVYVNASTRFTDGGVFGLGTEIGISTQKLHVRGPMGASALTTTKYLLRGEGQTR